MKSCFYVHHPYSITSFIVDIYWNVCESVNVKNCLWMVWRILIATSIHLFNSCQRTEWNSWISSWNLCVHFVALSAIALGISACSLSLSVFFFCQFHKILWRKLNDQSDESHAAGKLCGAFLYTIFTIHKISREQPDRVRLQRTSMWILILVLCIVCLFHLTFYDIFLTLHLYGNFFVRALFPLILLLLVVVVVCYHGILAMREHRVHTSIPWYLL